MCELFPAVKYTQDLPEHSSNVAEQHFTNVGAASRSQSEFLAHKECQRRISAVKRSAPVAHGIWRKGTCYVTKRSALLARVVGPLMPAAEAVLYTSTEWKKFDKTISVCARRALNGRATRNTSRPDGTITYSSRSHENVRRYWRLPTAHTEARVRRLRWAQELSQRPQTHCQVLAACSETSPLRGYWCLPRGANRTTCRTMGQAIEDIESMADTVAGAEDFLQELDKRWLLLFCDTHMADRVPTIRHG